MLFVFVSNHSAILYTSISPNIHLHQPRNHHISDNVAKSGVCIGRVYYDYYRPRMDT